MSASLSSHVPLSGAGHRQGGRARAGSCLILSLFLSGYACLESKALAGTITGTTTCGAYCDSILIYVEDVPGEWSGAGEVAILDQVNKEYVPHVMAVLIGTTVRLQNSDPELHNVHSYFNKNSVFSISLPFQGQTVDTNALTEPGRYVMLCDLHTEMSAYIVVLDNPYFTKPDSNGFYEIQDLPPGKYTLVKYDPEEKERVDKEVVLRGASAQVDF
jgi:plastocyanin